MSRSNISVSATSSADARDPRHHARSAAAGYDFLAVSSDLGLLMRGAQAAVLALRHAGSEAHVHTLAEGTRTGGG